MYICENLRPVNYSDQMKIPESWRILVTGVTSIHGWPIFTQLSELLPESSLYGLRPPKSDVPDSNNISSFCITERAELERIRDKFKPTHVIHCAGVCDLDVCEERPEWAYALNVQGTKAVADVFWLRHTHLVHEYRPRILRLQFTDRWLCGG